MVYRKMFEQLQLQLNMEHVYPILVVSTVSGGKSTLINSLVGKDILPSVDSMGTVKAVAILDNNKNDIYEIHAISVNGQYSLIHDASKEKIIQYNDINEVSELIIKGQIKGIRNSKRSMLLIDTPAIDHARNWQRKFITRKAIDECAEGMILCVIDITNSLSQGVAEFISYIAQKITGNEKLKIVFVINKMDLIDPDIENPKTLIKNIKDYIESLGILNPILVLTSAYSALLFKKVLVGECLTEREKDDYIINYRRFKRQGYSLADYLYYPESGNMQDVFEIDECKYTRAEIEAALYNTGLPVLERLIDETLVYSYEDDNT